MTDAEWDLVKKRLGVQYRPVNLLIDGYHVTLELTRIGAYKLAITFFIDGHFKGIWFSQDCEERRRFFPMTLRNVYDLKARAAFRRFSKSTRAIMKIDPDQKYPTYGFCWTSFARMKRHFIKSNKSIELTGEPEL
ncbi:MAG: hypothetical protein NTY86_02530 [Deltaproteobacteria bacterium]|nr:hypothetical protein [Deltaproteobacteria bacterium]